MPEKIPKCPVDLPKHHAAGREIREFQIKLVTPMFGGGAAPGEPDADFPIRATAIRGHLRFWWRIVKGNTLGDQMWRREEEIFGSTEFPSPLRVSVTSTTKVDMFDPKDSSIVPKFGPVAYALFSAIENNKQVAKSGIEFDLRLQIASEYTLNQLRHLQNRSRAATGQAKLNPTIDAIENDIDLAIAAWLHYGGLGGRTRRGCGALYCKQPMNELPVIPARIFIGKKVASASLAWESSVEVYRLFRQTPRGPKHNKQLKNGKIIPVPGRSHWPEADSIRKLTGCALRTPAQAEGAIPDDQNPHDHSRPVVPSELLPAFPKAELGLPINFHFLDSPGKGVKATASLNPKDVQLVPLLAGNTEKSDKRMASPVITRPLFRNGNWHPGVIILDRQLPIDFKVRLEGKGAKANGSDLAALIAREQIINPSLGKLRPMRNQPSAIEALIVFLKEKGNDFEEVKQ